MKYLVILSLLATQAFGFGILSLKQSSRSTKGHYYTEASLYTDQKLIGNLNYRSWTGYRLGEWFSSYTHIMLPVSDTVRLGFGPGFENNHQHKRDIRFEGVIEWRAW